MIEHKAVTLTKEEIVKDICVVVEGVLRDNIEDLVRGDTGSSLIFNHYKGIPQKGIKEIGDMWSELCSEEFLNRNPDVTDVLMIEELMNDGSPIKSWLASRT